MRGTGPALVFVITKSVLPRQSRGVRARFEAGGLKRLSEEGLWPEGRTTEGSSAISENEIGTVCKPAKGWCKKLLRCYNMSERKARLLFEKNGDEGHLPAP